MIIVYFRGHNTNPLRSEAQFFFVLFLTLILSNSNCYLTMCDSLKRKPTFTGLSPALSSLERKIKVTLTQSPERRNHALLRAPSGGARCVRKHNDKNNGY